MEGGLDRGDGGLRGGVGSGEGAEADAEGVGVGGDHLAAFDTRRDQAHGDMGVGAAVAPVFAGNSKIERITIVGFSVNGNGIGGDHAKRMSACVSFGFGNLSSKAPSKTGRSPPKFSVQRTALPFDAL